jgi:hypothetical protein
MECERWVDDLLASGLGLQVQALPVLSTILVAEDGHGYRPGVSLGRNGCLIC